MDLINYTVVTSDVLVYGVGTKHCAQNELAILIMYKFLQKDRGSRENSHKMGERLTNKQTCKQTLVTNKTW